MSFSQGSESAVSRLAKLAASCGSHGKPKKKKKKSEKQGFDMPSAQVPEPVGSVGPSGGGAYAASSPAAGGATPPLPSAPAPAPQQPAAPLPGMVGTPGLTAPTLASTAPPVSATGFTPDQTAVNNMFNQPAPSGQPLAGTGRSPGRSHRQQARDEAFSRRGIVPRSQRRPSRPGSTASSRFTNRIARQRGEDMSSMSKGGSDIAALAIKVANLGGLEASYVADAAGADNFLRGLDVLTDKAEPESGIFDDAMIDQANTGKVYQKRKRHAASNFAENPSARLLNVVDPTKLLTGDPNMTATGASMAVGKGNPEKRQRVLQKYKDVIHKYQDKLDPDGSITSRQTPFHRLHQAAMADQDTDIAGHVQQRNENALNYWLNPLDRTGPLHELAGRMDRRHLAGRADPDSTSGRFLRGLSDLPTAGLYSVLMGGEEAQQRLRRAAVQNKLYGEESMPEEKQADFDYRRLLPLLVGLGTTGVGALGGAAAFGNDSNLKDRLLNPDSYGKAIKPALFGGLGAAYGTGQIVQNKIDNEQSSKQEEKEAFDEATAFNTIGYPHFSERTKTDRGGKAFWSTPRNLDQLVPNNLRHLARVAEERPSAWDYLKNPLKNLATGGKYTQEKNMNRVYDQFYLPNLKTGPKPAAGNSTRKAIAPMENNPMGGYSTPHQGVLTPYPRKKQGSDGILPGLLGPSEDSVLKSLVLEKIAESAAWQRKAGKNSEGGLNAKGRASYNKSTGGNLKAPVTSKNPKGKAKKRKSSFCARMSGMKKKNTSKATANDPDSRINKSLRKWNC